MGLLLWVRNISVQQHVLYVGPDLYNLLWLLPFNIVFCLFWADLLLYSIAFTAISVKRLYTCHLLTELTSLNSMAYFYANAAPSSSSTSLSSSYLSKWVATRYLAALAPSLFSYSSSTTRAISLANLKDSISLRS